MTESNTIMREPAFDPSLIPRAFLFPSLEKRREHGNEV